MSEAVRPSLLQTRHASWLSTTADDEPPQSSGEGSRSQKSSKQKSRLPGGRKAVAAFCVSLVAFTIQTEAAQYVQQTLGYRKPFLSLYLGHSSFVFLFPLHLLYLRIAHPLVPLSHYLHLIAQNIHWQVSTPTAVLPIPAADSIRRRISSLSMRAEIAELNRDDAASEFEVEDLVARHTTQIRRLGPPPYTTRIEEKIGFNLWKLLGLFGVLTIGITIPALSWYSAVPLTTMADITTIYNTYAVWALVFSIWFLGEKWEMRKVCSVLLACGGVVLVAYGGAEHRRRPREPATQPDSTPDDHLTATASIVAETLLRKAARMTAPDANSNAFLGDLLAFFGAVTMAAYEMAFKIIGTLPDPEAQRERYARSRNTHIIDHAEQYEEGSVRGAAGSEGEGQGLLQQGQGEEDADEAGVAKELDLVRKSIEASLGQEDDFVGERSTERTGLWNPRESVEENYQTMSPAPEEEEDIGIANDDTTVKKQDQQSGNVRIVGVDHEEEAEEALFDRTQQWIPPPLPFGMHPIIVTSGIGLVTLCTLWIGLPIADLLGWEELEMPPNFKTVFFLFLVVFNGIIFNGCFSILLAIWGPVLASVSCLLTTVLVFIADIILGHDFKWISLLGCVSIGAGFGVLVSGDGMH